MDVQTFGAPPVVELHDGLPTAGRPSEIIRCCQLAGAVGASTGPCSGPKVRARATLLGFCPPLFCAGRVHPPDPSGPVGTCSGNSSGRGSSLRHAPGDRAREPPSPAGRSRPPAGSATSVLTGLTPGPSRRPRAGSRRPESAGADELIEFPPGLGGKGGLFRGTSLSRVSRWPPVAHRAGAWVGEPR